MTGTLALLGVLAGVVFYWLNGARAREMATAVVDELCQRRGFQLLDGTVSLARLGLVRTEYGLRFRRLFRFEYSIEGVGRQQGNILLHGAQVALVDLLDTAPPQPPAPDADTESATVVADEQKKDGKVVPFRRRD